MSGGPKGAKRPLERPLDGGVRRRLPGGPSACGKEHEHAGVCDRNETRRSKPAAREDNKHSAQPKQKMTLLPGACLRKAQSRKTARAGTCFAAKLIASQSWGLTFDMSGGAKGAKRPLGRPLDGGVRTHWTKIPGVIKKPSVRTSRSSFIRA